MSGFVEKPEPVEVPGLTHLHTGKVRDLYRNAAGELVMVASDRISAYDWVLPTEIPDKGRILTQLSLWWFEQLADLVPHHVLSTEVPAGAPADWAGPHPGLQVAGHGPRSSAWPAATSPARAWPSTEQTRTVCGLALPEGLVDGSELPAPIFTPATKADVGDHDENVSYEEVAHQVGAETPPQLRQTTLAVYGRARDIARERGIILADTKFEFGFDGERLILADEVLTPDSSRFWPADLWQPGRAQPSFDKQFVRDWLTSPAVRLGPHGRAAAARPPARDRRAAPAPSTSRPTSASRAFPGRSPSRPGPRWPGPASDHTGTPAHEEGPGRYPYRPGPSPSERTTRFELATSTLARLRSTN